jgi:hypothetical protein
VGARRGELSLVSAKKVPREETNGFFLRVLHLGDDPAPANFAQLLGVTGRERASGPTRGAKWAKKWFALANSGQRDLVKASR